MIAALSFALALAGAPASPAPQSAAIVAVDAAARTAGNRKPDAYQLGLVLLGRRWPAQLVKIRVDAVGSHAVAGLVLSGVKFHGDLDADGFLAEVAALVDQTLRVSHVEEVDVWATVPLDAGKGAVVAGDYARPTSRIVFSFTARRSDPNALRRLRSGEGVYWADDWKASLAHH